MAPGANDMPSIDREVIFAQLDTDVLDETNARYQAIKDEIFLHLQPKIRMD